MFLSSPTLVWTQLLQWKYSESRTKGMGQVPAVDLHKVFELFMLVCRSMLQTPLLEPEVAWGFFAGWISSGIKGIQVLVLSKDYNPCNSSGEGFILLEVLFQGRFLPARMLAFPFPLPSCEKWEFTSASSDSWCWERNFPRTFCLPAESLRAFQFGPRWVLCFSHILLAWFWKMYLFFFQVNQQ